MIIACWKNAIHPKYPRKGILQKRGFISVLLHALRYGRFPERNQEEIRAFHLQNHQVKVTLQVFNSISDWISYCPVSPRNRNRLEYYSEKINFVEQLTA